MSRIVDRVEVKRFYLFLNKYIIWGTYKFSIAVGVNTHDTYIQDNFKNYYNIAGLKKSLVNTKSLEKTEIQETIEYVSHTGYLAHGISKN